jgi:hypothetical protein
VSAIASGAVRIQDDAGAFVEGKLMASQRDLASLISVTL